MRSRVIIFGLAMVLGHVLTESAEIIGNLFPSVQGRKVQPFIAYTWPWDPQGIDLLWWIKYNTEEFLWCVTFFVLAMVGREYNYRFFLMGMVFFLYHIIDWFMLWYDYKQSHFMYWTGCVALIAILGTWFWPERGEGRVVSLDRQQ